MIGIIVQPRWNHPDGRVRTQEFTPEDMYEFLVDVQCAIISHRKKEELFQVGGHCKYCPRMGSCPKIAAQVEEIEVAEDIDSMTPERIADLLQKKKTVLDFFDKLQKHAIDILEDGTTVVPGFKLVETYGRRNWKVTEEELTRAARNRKIGKKQLYDVKLKTPAQIEKIAGKEFVQKLSGVVTSGVTLAPVSDKRAGVDLVSVRKEFK